MLCDQLSKREDVKEIIALDKEPQGQWCSNIPKVTYVQHNMADDGWQEIVAAHKPDAVIHTAWQIRAMYGNAKEQWRWNVDGSDKVFEFALSQPSVKKFVYFSTASSYSARSDNRFDHLFTEDEGFRDDDYIYAHEKKVTEENLEAMYNTLKSDGATLPQVSIVRPAAVTGPRGRYMRIRFGLQSALSGNLKGGFINKVITTLTSFVPATAGWVRQFIHEDDVTDIVTKFVFDDVDWEYNAFNITPVSEAVYAGDMAKAVGRKSCRLRPGWHGSHSSFLACYPRTYSNLPRFMAVLFISSSHEW